METKYTITKKTLIAKITGELDHHTSVKLKEELIWNIENNPVINIILDLRELTFMDSSGIGLIIGRYKSVKEKGGYFHVIGLNPQVKKVFDIAGLDKYIKQYKTLEEAIL